MKSDPDAWPWRRADGVPNLGFTAEHCWFRLPVRNVSDQPADWWLVVECALLGELDVHVLDGDRAVADYRAGMDRRFDTRPAAEALPAFP